MNLNLVEVRLQHNELKSLSQKTFSKLPNLNRLDLRENKCINREWISEATQWMEDIVEGLNKCHTNYVTDTTQKLEQIGLSTLNKTLIEISKSLTGKFENLEKFVETRFKEMAGQISELKSTNRELAAKVEKGCGRT